MSITGRGAASKEQVASMLMNILKFKKPDMELDATDGLAAAMCHFYQSGKPSGNSRATSWKQFIKNNPGRVK
jgi:crossover junction endodeoxyribonuclease RuvC